MKLAEDERRGLQRKICEELEEEGLPYALREARALIALASRSSSPQDFDTSCRLLVQRRLAREPLQYMEGQMDFYGCTLQVDKRVLIPRPETEILVDHLVQRLKAKDLRGKVLVDIGCGSGCIAIALKRCLPQLHVIATDLSEEALDLAYENAHANEVEVEFRQGNFLAPLRGELIDIAVSNPPYVSEEEWRELEPEVRLYEPRQALVAQEEGLFFYRILAQELPSLLQEGALVALEIGSLQGPPISHFFSASPWLQSSLEKDWSGHDRFFFVEKH